MVTARIRIISDVHFGDRASRIGRLEQLRPLLDGVDHLVLNGDTLDTRPGPAPEYTAECRATVLDFFPRAVAQLTLVTGNHDPDISSAHAVDLAASRVFVTHGDIIFDSIVPWGRDARLLGQQIAAGLASLTEAEREHLETRLAVWRRVAGALPQRHQSERNPLKYALRFAADTVWPPGRVLRILRAWRQEPRLVAELVRRHRPRARFALTGHTHRAGIYRSNDGLVVINTGAFCPPSGAYIVDLESERLLVRMVEPRSGEFRVSRTIAEFPLAQE